MLIALTAPTAAVPQVCKVTGSNWFSWYHNWEYDNSKTAFTFNGNVFGGESGRGSTISCPNGSDRLRVEHWVSGMQSVADCEPGANGFTCEREAQRDTEYIFSEGTYLHNEIATGTWCSNGHHVFVDVAGTRGSTQYNSPNDCQNLGQITEDMCALWGGVWEGEHSHSPIIIPLTRSQAYKLTSAVDGVVFDLDGDGVETQTAWTAADSKLAFLALDRNGNGLIDNGSELFGNRTLPGATNGFLALQRMEPINGPLGWVDGDDPIFPKLLLWEDRNHNGVSEAAELTKADAYLARIGFGTSVHKRKDRHGNLFGYRGWATLRTGPGRNEPTSGNDERARQINIYDVFFVQ